MTLTVTITNSNSAPSDYVAKVSKSDGSESLLAAGESATVTLWDALTFTVSEDKLVAVTDDVDPNAPVEAALAAETESAPVEAVAAEAEPVADESLPVEAPAGQEVEA